MHHRNARHANRRRALLRLAALLLALVPSLPVMAEDAVFIPVLAPITGILALEGRSQMNGAVMALEAPPAGIRVDYEELDTGDTPAVAVLAFERALRGPRPVAVSAPIFGPQMLALLPLAAAREMPLVTISGTASITEQGNPWVFRFFPGDAVVKQAQARYAIAEIGGRRPAIVHQTTAYGQSGRRHLAENLEALGAEVVLTEALAVDVRDMLPAISRIRAAGADIVLLQLHSGPTALFVRQARAAGLDLPIVAGSAMHQPATAALLEPAELAGVCAETAASPVSGGSPAMVAFAEAYRAAFDIEPDAFAVGQYDGLRMVLAAVDAGARTATAVQAALATGRHEGLAMTYLSDGRGNMAHDALIVCYDGASRIPHIARRYHDLDGVLAAAAD